MTPSAFFYAASVVFAAGAFYAGMKIMKRDVNGLGQKQRKMVLALILAAGTAEQKDEVAKLLLG